MDSTQDPVVGNWYRRLDDDAEFQVVAMDAFDGFVELQHFHGEVEAMELEQWYAMVVEDIEPPKDWSDPLSFAVYGDGDGAGGELEQDWERGFSEWPAEESSPSYE
ncbi:MAG TPA: hypothetical protein ENJ19_11680 [Gammaproteobacteria bacterium]|nr:hypothetical protein [Gammaproteobacteria bacterium]